MMRSGRFGDLFFFFIFDIMKEKENMFDFILYLQGALLIYLVFSMAAFILADESGEFFFGKTEHIQQAKLEYDMNRIHMPYDPESRPAVGKIRRAYSNKRVAELKKCDRKNRKYTTR